MAGLVTATTLSGELLPLLIVLPSVGAALALALGTRLLLTGAFHEDGLGDFFDGFGGGRERSQILAIMKDSHVGSYAVLGLILYYLTYWALGTSLPAGWLPAVLFASDITGKVTSLLQVQFLPYARREEDSKIGVTYRKARPLAIYAALAIFLTAQWWALRPIEATPIGGSELTHFVPLSIFLPILVGGGLIAYLRKRIDGYTGRYLRSAVPSLRAGDAHGLRHPLPPRLRHLSHDPTYYHAPALHPPHPPRHRTRCLLRAK